MIGRLTGEVVEETEDRLTLDVGGVGYEVAVPPYPLKALRARLLPPDDPKARLLTLGQPVTLYVYTHATERSPVPVLFGFNDLNERRFFELLLTVSGFGPVAAAKSMTISVPEYASRVMTRDVRALSKLPGIGTAKAEQMVAKLRSRMALFAMMPEEKLPERPVAAGDALALQAQIALEDLGYRPQEAEALIHAARQSHPDAASVEALLDAVWAASRK